MRLTPSPHPASHPASWSVVFGLAALLALVATVWWRLGDVLTTPTTAPARPPEATATAAAPLRLTIAADGALAMAGAAVTLEDLPARVKPPGSASATAQALELAVDPRAPGAAVAGILGRLREAGITSITLVVEPPSGASP